MTFSAVCRLPIWYWSQSGKTSDDLVVFDNAGLVIHDVDQCVFVVHSLILSPWSSNLDRIWNEQGVFEFQTAPIHVCQDGGLPPLELGYHNLPTPNGDCLASGFLVVCSDHPCNWSHEQMPHCWQATHFLAVGLLSTMFTSSSSSIGWWVGLSVSDPLQPLHRRWGRLCSICWLIHILCRCHWFVFLVWVFLLASSRVASPLNSTLSPSSPH